MNYASKYNTQNVTAKSDSLFDLLPDHEATTARPEAFYRARLKLIKKIYAKRQAQKAGLVNP